MNRLKELRQRAGLSQTELAEKAGLSPWTVRAYEQGKRDLRKAGFCTLICLAHSLGCKVPELIGKEAAE